MRFSQNFATLDVKIIVYRRPEKISLIKLTLKSCIERFPRVIENLFLRSSA